MKSQAKFNQNRINIDLCYKFLDFGIIQEAEKKLNLILKINSGEVRHQKPHLHIIQRNPYVHLTISLHPEDDFDILSVKRGDPNNLNLKEIIKYLKNSGKLYKTFIVLFYIKNQNLLRNLQNQQIYEYIREICFPKENCSD